MSRKNHKFYYPSMNVSRTLIAISNSDYHVYIDMNDHVIDYDPTDKGVINIVLHHEHHAIKNNWIVTSGYAYVEKPMRINNSEWVFHIFLTELGDRAVECINLGLVWDDTDECIDLYESRDYYLEDIRSKLVDKNTMVRLIKLKYKPIRQEAATLLRAFLKKSVRIDSYRYDAQEWADSIVKQRKLTSEHINAIKTIKDPVLKRKIGAQLAAMKMFCKKNKSGDWIMKYDSVRS